MEPMGGKGSRALPWHRLCLHLQRKPNPCADGRGPCKNSKYYRNMPISKAHAS